MPISGLAVTLSNEPALAERAVAELSRECRIEVGVRGGHRVAIVVETQSHREDRDVWAWLNGLAGVRRVDVVYIHFDEDESEGAATESASRLAVEASNRARSEAKRAIAPRESCG